MNKLLKRTLFGALYVALVVGCILLGPWTTMLLAAAFAILGYLELTKITVGLGGNRSVAIATDILALAVLCLVPCPASMVLALVVVLARIVEELYIKSPNPLASLGLSLAAMVYIGLPCYLLSVMGQTGWCDSLGFSLNRGRILLLFLFIWTNDTGAFCVGSLMGRHKMFPRISPKKTWEGYFGGMFFCVVLAIILALCCPDAFWHVQAWYVWVGLAVVCSVFSTWGDLVESLVKRTLGIKDSGNLIPGHGGILDRIDSFLLVMPAAALYYLLVVVI